MLVFGKRGADFGLSDAHGAAFAALLPPAVRTDGGEMLLAVLWGAMVIIYK